MARKPKGREKSCVAASLRVNFKMPNVVYFSMFLLMPSISQIQHWFQMFGKFRQLGRPAAARSARLLMKIKLIILEIFHRNWYSFFKKKSGGNIKCAGYFSCSERSLPCSVDISTIYDLHIFKWFLSIVVLMSGWKEAMVLVPTSLKWSFC